MQIIAGSHTVYLNLCSMSCCKCKLFFLYHLTENQVNLTAATFVISHQNVSAWTFEVRMLPIGCLYFMCLWNRCLQWAPERWQIFLICKTRSSLWKVQNDSSLLVDLSPVRGHYRYPCVTYFLLLLFMDALIFRDCTWICTSISNLFFNRTP